MDDRILNGGIKVQEYKNKQELINEILKQAELFINEFVHVHEEDKDKLIHGIDRTPAQMIAYQLGWLNLILTWEKQENEGVPAVTPHPGFKWNNLGGLYNSFYKQYTQYSIGELLSMFQESVQQVKNLVDSFTEAELFLPGERKWASSTPANWPVWKWIHINTVAPFKTFRAKIRKWKRLNLA